MKLKIGWKALGKALGNAVKPVLLGAVGSGVIALTCTRVRFPLYGSTFSPVREYVPPSTGVRSPYTSELSGV